MLLLSPCFSPTNVPIAKHLEAHCLWFSFVYHPDIIPRHTLLPRFHLHFSQINCQIHLTVVTCYTSPYCCSYDLKITQQMTHRSQSSRAWKKFNGPIRLQGYESLSFHWIRETVQIEVIIVRSNFHVNISEHFTIHEFMRTSFEGSVNMDL